MRNPYEDRKSRIIGTAGRQSEKRFAKRIGAKLTPNSGATAHSKGDMHTSAFLIEHKSTSSNSLGIQRDWLLKISHEALHTNKTPALAIAFTNKDGAPLTDGEWVAIPVRIWKELFG
jgi:hypothetical protein